jgi:adenosylhomocysteine nucleosidase
MPSSNSTSTVAIIAALPREIARLVRGVRADAEALRHGIHLYRIDHAIVVAAGMGAARAAIAVGAALAAAPVTTLISAGLAGACSPELRAGEAAEANLVIDAKTGERFAPENHGQPGYTLVTTEAIASVQEKARLATAYRASLVDMEAATVARLASAHGFGFRAIKGISDEHDFELASLARFAGKHGSFRTSAFALHTAVRPHRWTKTVQLGRDSSRALTALHAALRESIDRNR